ncbi:hypothetical protein [Thalassoglobus neptunius]|nr:hypothetical protein [Thalassoglobus neptunius]
MKRLATLLLAVVSMSSIQCFGQTSEDSLEVVGFDGPSVESVEAVWAGEISRVTTARIESQVSSGALWEPLQISPREIALKIDSIETSDPEEKIYQLIEVFNPEAFKQYKSYSGPGEWTMTFVETLLNNGVSERTTGPEFDHVMVDDLHLVKSFPLKDPPTDETIKAYDRSQPRWGFYRLVSYLPTSELTNFRPVEVEPLPSEGNTVGEYIVRNASGSTVAIDGEHLLPLEIVIRKSEDAIPSQVKYFRDYTLFPGDVLMPLEHYEFHFDSEGKLKSWSVKLIRSAVFNVELNESEFQMPASAGAIAIDFRNPEYTRGNTLQQSFSDVKEYFLAQSEYIKNMQPEPPLESSIREVNFSWRSLLLILNGIVLMVIGFVLWRRQV